MFAPLPSSGQFNKTVVHAVESVVIDWTHQIRDVLQRDSAEQLLQGKHPNPSVEMEFWKERAANLEGVYNQVSIMVHLTKFNCRYEV